MSAPPPGFSRFIPLLVISLGLIGVGYLPVRKRGPEPRAEKTPLPQVQAHESPTQKNVVLILGAVSVLFLGTALSRSSLRNSLWPQQKTARKRWPKGLVVLEVIGLWLLLSFAIQHVATLENWAKLIIAPFLSILLITYALAREPGSLRERAEAMGLAGGVSFGRSVRAGASAWLALWCVLYCVLLLSCYFIVRLLGPEAEKFIRDDLKRGALETIRPFLNRPGLVILWLALAAIIIPILEEILFRGLLYGTLRQYVGPVAAGVLSASLFAAVHSLWIGAAPLFVLGCVLAWLYERTGSIWSAIALHATHNAVQLGLALFIRTLLP